jgi:predicted alpha/beta superfamily hydrolase
VECLQRRLSSQRAAFSTGVVVAIAYPLPSDSKSVMSHRRAFDLTPPSPGCDPSEGGADAFLDFIQFHVKPFVHHRVSAILGAKPGKEALYGHSYGGLFCLHSLFTRPDTFDCFIVSSPSIWWNNEFVLREEQTFRDASGKTRPDLLLFVGGLEQDPPRQRGENDIEYHKRQKRHQERKMVENVLRQHERLCKSGRLGRLSAKVYDGEDHGTVIGCSLSQGLATFFEDWPLSIG